jgi:hypothetical protein
MTVTTRDFCATDVAEQYAASVMSLASRWTTRKRGLSTLGAAAYIDAPPESAGDMFAAQETVVGQYEQQLNRSNPVLAEHFGPLHQLLLTVLGEVLQAPVSFAPGKALPGFHIFEYAPENAHAGSHVAHFDRQYETLDWQGPINHQTTPTISFTLPLRLPSSGGGLMVWEVMLDDVLNLDKEATRDYIRNASRQRIKYQVGELVIHPGHALHMIYPWQSKTDEQRITLQGHCIMINNQWLAYW